MAEGDLRKGPETGDLNSRDLRLLRSLNGIQAGHPTENNR